MPDHILEITLLPDALAVCRLHKDEPIPGWARSGELLSETRTREELSIVCSEACLPAAAAGDNSEAASDGGLAGMLIEAGFRAFQVKGPLSFALTGVLSSLLAPLAAQKVPVFVLSTYNTDYLLVKAEYLERAVRALGTVCTVHGTGR